jgi:gliding motility-associated-like protein
MAALLICIVRESFAAAHGSGLYSSKYDTLVVGAAEVKMTLKPQLGQIVQQVNIMPARGSAMQWFDAIGDLTANRNTLNISIMQDAGYTMRTGYIYAQNGSGLWDTIVLLQPAKTCMPSQGSSSGTKFLAAFLENLPTSPAANAVHLFLYAVSASDDSVSITHPSSMNSTWNTTRASGMTKNKIYAYKIDTIYYDSFKAPLTGNAQPPYAYNQEAEVILQNSLMVESQQPISLYAYNAGVNSSDAANILPLDALGSEYYALSYNSSTNYTTDPATPEEFMVAASQDNTLVTIVPSGNTTTNNNTYAVKSKDALEPFTIRLNMGQTYLLKAQISGGNDGIVYTQNSLTGSYIKATKPIAVFSGHRRVHIGRNGPRDNLYEQLLPLELWGTRYIVANTTSHLTCTPAGQTPAANRCRILAAHDGTIINISTALGNSVVTLQRGEFSEFTINTAQEYAIVEASKPVSAALFEETSPCSGNGSSDPFMLVLSPIENGVSSVSFAPFPFFANNDAAMGNRHYVTMIVATAHKAHTTLLMEGVGVVDTIDLTTFWHDIPSGYSYASAQVAYRSDRNYHLSNPYGLTSYAFGHGNAESYGYLLGMSYIQMTEPILSDTFYCKDHASPMPLPSTHDGKPIFYYASIEDWQQAQPLAAAPTIQTNKDTILRWFYSAAPPCCSQCSLPSQYPYPREYMVRIFPGSESLTFNDDTLCLQSDSAAYGALPAGGEYSYVKNGVWQPFNHKQAGAGRHRVTYTYTNQESGGACVYSKQAWITVRQPSPHLTANAPTTFCHGQNLQLQVSGMDIDSIQWKWTNGVDTIAMTSAAAGNIAQYSVNGGSIRYQSGRYAAYAYDMHGCWAWADTPVNIIVPPPAPIVKPSAPLSYCMGDSITLYDSILRALPYQWFRQGYKLSADTFAMYKSKESMGGSYRYVVGAAAVIAGRQRDNYCWSYDTIDVSVNMPPALYMMTINRLQHAICRIGDSAKIKAMLLSPSPPAAAYEWTYSDGINPMSAMPQNGDSIWAHTAGLYGVSAVSAAGCRSSAFTMNVDGRNMPQTPRIIAGNAVCEGNAAILSVQQPYGNETYHWCSADSNEIYTMPISSRCSVYFNHEYVVRADVSYSDGMVCSAFSAPQHAGMYPKPLPPIVVNKFGGSDSSCHGEPKTFAARRSAADSIAIIGSWQWFRADTAIVPPQTDSILYINIRGGAAYKVRALSTHGCVSDFSAPKPVLIDPPADIVITPADYSVCAGGTAMLRSPVSNPEFSYQWTKNGMVITNAANPFYEITSSIVDAEHTDRYQLSVTIPRCGAPFVSNEAAVHVHAMPAAAVINGGATTAAACAGSDIALTASTMAGVKFYWYKDGRLDSVITGTASYLLSGVQSSDAGLFSVEVENIWGCRSNMSSMILLDAAAPHNVVFTRTTACSDETMFVDVQPSGGEFICMLGCENPAYFNPSTAGGSRSVRYLHTNEYGCTTTKSELINIVQRPAVPAIYSRQPLMACEHGGILVTLYGNTMPDYTFRWYKDGAPLLDEYSDSMNYRARSKGTYELLVSNGACPALNRSNALTIGEYAAATSPQAVASDTAFCPGGSVRLFSEKPSTGFFQWVKIMGGRVRDIAGATDVSYYVDSVGTYSVRWIDEHGCLTALGTMLSIKLYDLPAPKPQIAAPASQYYYGLHYTLRIANPEPHLRYQWYRNGAPTAMRGAEYAISRFAKEDVARYEALAVNSHGCELLSDYYEITAASDRFFIPNIFTPNGDGVNDYFEIVGLDAFVGNKLEILTKNGVVIYSVSDYVNDWDGGGYPTDVYYYHLEVKDHDGAISNHNGFVHLKR